MESKVQKRVAPRYSLLRKRGQARNEKGIGARIDAATITSLSALAVTGADQPFFLMAFFL
jgi:hypothetical protein